MPGHRNVAKGKTAKDDLRNNNGNVNIVANIQNDNAKYPADSTKCCCPSGCSEGFINRDDVGTYVRVLCNNDQCTVGNWMHTTCFESWESSVLSYLRSCGRARSWSEKQRLQNLWTKKGYDLAYKACDCKCGRGHLRKDLDFYIPAPTENKTKKKHKKKNEKPMPVVSSYGHGGVNINNLAQMYHTDVLMNNVPPRKSSVDNRNLSNGNAVTNTNTPVNDNANNAMSPQLFGDKNANNMSVRRSAPIILQRTRAGSISSSSGSSPPTSTDNPSPVSSPANFNANKKVNGFDFNVDNGLTIFKHRIDMSAFCNLPRHKQNSYHIKMADEDASGNDSTRLFILTNLSSYKVTSIECVLCKVELSVFYHYPLIDGSFFLSPQPYSGGVVQLITGGRMVFLNAVCVNCLEGWTNIRCCSCKSKWDGSTLQIGTMYSYDIFAAMPCCQKRLTCKACHRAIVDINRALPFYSEYTSSIECPFCKVRDTHFIRPLSETFLVKPSASIGKF